MILLALAAFLVRFTPFRLWAGLLGQLCPVTGATAVPAPLPSPQFPSTSAAVALALRSAARRIPWRCTCLMLTLAGRIMLARRGSGVLARLGVTADSGRCRAHAWLLVGDEAVTGGVEAVGYVPISDFVTVPKRR